jgi:copper chaperone NosL
MSWAAALLLLVPPAPGPRDTCPVCGMHVAPYPAWAATLVWDDGTALHFDGAKDLFKFLAHLPRYAPRRQARQIRELAVTEFYDVKRIDARAAFYVIGSDVMGPMGHELVPLATRADAEEFLRDHRGKRMLRFAEVTPALLGQVDDGRF